MSREIKFRAWDNLLEKFVLASYLSEQLVRTYTEDGSRELTLRGSIFTNNGLTLLQYTGLKDRHGKEIYEGDILRPTEQSSQKNIRIVEFVDGSFCYSLSNEWPSTKGYYSSLYTPRAKLFEVIGNIYENKELLK